MLLPPFLESQFVSGGLILMLSGAVMGLLRNIPIQIYNWCQRRFTVRFTIMDSDPLFEWAKIWLDSLPYSKKARNIACSLHREDDKEFSADSKAIFTPAPGSHFFRHNGRFVWMDRTKSEPPANGGLTGSKSRAFESISITVLGTDPQAARDIIQEIIQTADKEHQQRLAGYISSFGWWRKLLNYRPRDLETVDIPLADLVTITTAINHFLVSRAVYSKRGIPYHLNFLFAGLPGTGKTSLAAALSGYFGLKMHLLNIAGPGMNDERLVDLMLSLPPRSIILMEDVDALVPERKDKPKSSKTATPVASSDDDNSGITLSGLLNCMDGITAPDGAIIIMTTNHPELLDPALLRPGRVDIRINFGPATKEQMERMAKRLMPDFLDHSNYDWMLAKGYTTAQVQSVMMEQAKG